MIRTSRTRHRVGLGRQESNRVGVVSMTLAMVFAPVAARSQTMQPPPPSALRPYAFPAVEQFFRGYLVTRSRLAVLAEKGAGRGTEVFHCADQS